MRKTFDLDGMALEMGLDGTEYRTRAWDKLLPYGKDGATTYQQVFR